MEQQAIFEYSSKIKDEADQYLADIGILTTLSNIGDIHCIGSYAYNLMIAKDIDIHVLVPTFSRSALSQLPQTFFSKPEVRTVQITDNADRNKAHLPAGYYLQLKFGDGWKSDIWILTPEENQKTDQMRWQAKLKAITDEQRYYILLTKKLLFDSGHKFGPKAPSVTIYEKVLANEINSPETARTFAELFLRVSQ